jgi:hypothetical protein
MRYWDVRQEFQFGRLTLALTVALTMTVRMVILGVRLDLSLSFELAFPHTIKCEEWDQYMRAYMRVEPNRSNRK